MSADLTLFRNLFRDSLQNILTTIDPETIDDLLDNRDLTEFADSWNTAYKETENIQVDPEDQHIIDNAREEIFKLTFSATHSADLSAYISEDFELIALHWLAKTQNTWVNILCATYFENTIPEGQLKYTDKTLDELMTGNVKSS